VWTYDFGHKSDRVYRQRGLGGAVPPPGPAAPTDPAPPSGTALPRLELDPALLASGLAMLLLAALLPAVGRRRRLSFG
jgi:hypothetical protein